MGNQELQSMLANDDFTKVSNEIEVLQLLLDNNSDKSTEQENNVYKSLENLHETGKLTGSEYESLKESVQSTISKTKQITSQTEIDRKKDVIVGSYTLDSKLDHELKSILSDNEYGVISNDIQELFSMTEDSEEFNSQTEKIMDNLQTLLHDGKINDQEYQKLKESIEKEMDRKRDTTVGSFKLDSKLDSELSSILSDDEYDAINNEMLELVAMTEVSDEFDSQAGNIIINLQNLLNEGQINNQEYEKLKKLVEKEIDRKKDTIVGDFKLDSVLDHELKSILSDNDYGMVSKDMIALAKMSEDELDSQKEKIMNNLQNLFNNGKIDYQEYKKTKRIN